MHTQWPNIEPYIKTEKIYQIMKSIVTHLVSELESDESNLQVKLEFVISCQ